MPFIDFMRNELGFVDRDGIPYNERISTPTMSNYFSSKGSPTKAVNTKIANGIYDGWTIGLTDADASRTKYPAVDLGIRVNVDGDWRPINQLYWLPSDSGAPSIDSELVKGLCSLNQIAPSVGVDIAELSDIVAVTVQVTNSETTKTNDRGKLQTFTNPEITSMLPRKPKADEPLPPELRYSESGSVELA